MTSLEQAIEHAERVAAEQSAKAKTIESNPWGEKSKVKSKIQDCLNCAEEHRQLAAWLSILKKAKFEYDEAWRIITHPTPDVTYADRDRAQTILDTFRDSLGRMEK